MIDLLLSRASVKNLREPAPSDADLRRIFEAAVRAPDHGKLRPWRFFVIRGEAREKLGDLYAASTLRREPDASEGQLDKERSKPMKSPMLIAIAAKIVTGHKVPPVEQILSAGAAAMNILNAIHALGFAAKWVTGSSCYDPEFRKDFGLEADDQLAGFIHVGTPTEAPHPAERPDPSAFAVEWR